MKEYSFKKNDEIILTIDDISDDGSGIGRSDGFIFFVKNTLPGDRIKAKVMKVTKSYGFARCMEIIESSNGRCKARCSAFEKCGGCSLQNYKYEKQHCIRQQKQIAEFHNFGVVPCVRKLEQSFFFIFLQ